MIRNPIVLYYIFGIKPKTIIHIGAHHGQDGNNYRRLKGKTVIWGEADSNSRKILRQRFPNDIVIPLIFWSVSDLELDFFEFPGGQSNSAIPPLQSDSTFKISKKLTTSLDRLIDDEILVAPIMLVLDVQGAEMEVLLGGKKLLPKIQYLVVEIANRPQGYAVTPSEKEITDFLKNYGLIPSIIRKSHDEVYYDQLFIKSNKVRLIYIKLLDQLTCILMILRHWILYKHKPDYVFSCNLCNLK
jgi:FkbM family methyltransferase